jgi:SOS-response transcriptional repressor LexA
MTRRRKAVDPLKEVGLRRTHRTLRVLEVIATWDGRKPGPSSRQIAEAAGVKNEGQMSSLLTRLEELGLIEVTGRGWHTPGEPYVWSPTPKGKAVQRALEAEGGR